MKKEKNKKDKKGIKAKKTVKEVAKIIADATVETKDAALKKSGEIINKDNIEKGIENVKNTAQSIKENTQKTGENIYKKAEKIIPKKAVKSEFIVEYNDRKITEKEIVDKFNHIWNESDNKEDINSLKIYYKIEEETAYCVVNEKITIAIKLI
ncbi:DUF6465 family protein [Clostridium grantii]|uniref:Uncharacterized protein n=1 Tax=Clostridium grantii DSM 8605 TaxID=1121316 RepID=A0A1M5XGF6_9CLOT|nr:DUF6465 family protein [Clostridium grantii]SHH98891.1 hypothetical protein SAMN02745207_03632 [Clostridium grantii DSM 8605]